MPTEQQVPASASAEELIERDVREERFVSHRLQAAVLGDPLAFVAAIRAGLPPPSDA